MGWDGNLGWKQNFDIGSGVKFWDTREILGRQRYFGMVKIQGSLFLKESERSAREEFYKLAASREEFVLLGIVLHLLGGVRCK